MSTKEAMDLGGSRRRVSAPKAGSVWESRMKLDEVKGGIKVFDTTHDNSEPNNSPKSICSTSSSASALNSSEVQLDKKVNTMRPKQSPAGVSGKRKTWKAENPGGSPIQIARQRSENMDEQNNELSVSADRIKKSPVQIKKTRSVRGSRDQSNDGKERNLIQLRKVRSDASETFSSSKCEANSELDRDVKSDNLDESSDENLKSSLSFEMVKAKTGVPRKVLDQCIKIADVNESAGGIEKSPIGLKKSTSDEDCKELVVCEEKNITSNLDNVGRTKTLVNVDNSVDGEEEDEWDNKETDKEIEVGVEVEEKNLDIKVISVHEQKKPNKFVLEEKKLLHGNEKPVPYSPIVKKHVPPVINHARIHPSPTKNKPIPVPEHFHGIPRSHSKLQSFVDLVMWRDVSRSAFIFGIGTFVIISSSYTKDLNISFISVVSYLGLVYLAAIFILRSLINRGSVSMDDPDQEYVVGEEEAVWVIKLVLPYINEFLLKLRALFSGDPATTMKLAVLLFSLARCGSSITIWKVTRLGFFGVFIVPKVCSSYSSHLTAFGTFWIRRFGDAWESCSHKKAVGFAVFALVWNLSSVVARIWAVFMLFVGFKYYQQCLIREGWARQEAGANETDAGKVIGGRRSATATATATATADNRKEKKVC